LEHGRDAKVLVFKYKNKTRYRRRHGHRQDFTRLAIRDILIDGKPSQEGVTEEKPKSPVRRRPAKPKATTAAPEAEAAAATGATDEPEATTEAPKTRRARAAAATGEPKAAKPRARKASAPKTEPAAEASREPAEEE
jgi:hypothetical protein